MDILLINMPFHGFWPSLGLSLLKAQLASENLSSKVLYFGLPFAKKIGKALYEEIANGAPRPTDLLGEWIFTPALYGASSYEYVDEILKNRSKIYPEENSVCVPENFIDTVVQVHSLAAAFADECTEKILSYRPKIVGFGSVFHQQIASLSIAKRLKTKSPDTFIVFGGGNCEGTMGLELVRRFPFVDAVVSGEGEIVLPQIVKRRLANKDIDSIKGVFRAPDIAQAAGSAEKYRNLDDLPYPDFDDYFDQKNECGLDLPDQIVFETSRGCWWGEKSHCTFCGISDDAMSYRSKSGARALEEIAFLTEKYKSKKVHVVDCILDMKYFRDFFPQLAARDLNLQLFYEVKANLKKDQLRILKDAGVNTIQPGIESFSDEILSLMGKGVKAAQNIQLLKWCKELGIGVSWNILWGFPGENPEDYKRMVELIPLLSHLTPPQAVGRIRLDRFSPYFERPNAFGLTGVRPHNAYKHIYNLNSDAIQNLAYFFLHDYRGKTEPWQYAKPLWDQVRKWWWRSDGSNDLFYFRKQNHLIICDLRSGAKQPIQVLSGFRKDLYLFCDKYRSFSEMQHDCAETNRCELEPALAQFLQTGIMVKGNNLYLSLATPIEEYALKDAALIRFCTVLSEYGHVTAPHELTVQLKHA